MVYCVTLLHYSNEWQCIIKIDEASFDCNDQWSISLVSSNVLMQLAVVGCMAAMLWHCIGMGVMQLAMKLMYY